MMGESYARVKEQAELHAVQLRAEVIIDMERGFTREQLKNEKWFPAYVQTLSPVEPEHSFENADMEQLDVSTTTVCAVKRPANQENLSGAPSQRGGERGADEGQPGAGAGGLELGMHRPVSDTALPRAAQILEIIKKTE